MTFMFGEMTDNSLDHLIIQHRVRRGYIAGQELSPFNGEESGIILQSRDVIAH